jgi:hypothetical protein
MPALFETVEESKGMISQTYHMGGDIPGEIWISGLTLALGPVARIARIHMVGSPKWKRRRLID